MARAPSLTHFRLEQLIVSVPELFTFPPNYRRRRWHRSGVQQADFQRENHLDPNDLYDEISHHELQRLLK